MDTFHIAKLGTVSSLAVNSFGIFSTREMIFEAAQAGFSPDASVGIASLTSEGIASLRYVPHVRGRLFSQAVSLT